MISGVRVGDFTTHGKFLVRVVSTKECDGEIAHKTGNLLTSAPQNQWLFPARNRLSPKSRRCVGL